MVTERVEVLIKTGDEGNFIKAIKTGLKILLAGGATSVELKQGIENPSKFLLCIDWHTVEDHVAFTNADQFDDFKQLIGCYFAGKPEMEHFQTV